MQSVRKRDLGLLWLLPILFFFAVNEYYPRIFLNDHYDFDNRRIIEIIMLLCIALSLLISRPLRTFWINQFCQLHKRARLFIGLFFAVGIISSCITPLPKYAFLQVALYGLLFINALTIASLYVNFPKQLSTILCTTIIVSVGFYCLFAFMAYLVDLHSQIGKLEQMYNATNSPAAAWVSFSNPRFLLQFMCWSLPFLPIPLMLYDKAMGFWRWPYIAIASYYWCLAIANQSRLVILMTSFITLLVLFMFGKRAISWLIQQLYLFIIGYVFYQLLFKIGASEGARNLVDYHDPARFTLWKTALKLFTDSPILGVGPGHFPYYAYAYETIASHPHNAILLFLSEWGIVATLCVLALAIWGVWRWIKVVTKKIPQEENHTLLYAIALTASLTAAAMDAMVDGGVIMPMSQIMLAIIPGWMLGLYWSKSETDSISVRKWHSGIFILVLIAASATFIHGIYPDVFRLIDIQKAYILQCHDQLCSLNPNFWIQGWIQFYNAGLNG